MLTLNITGVEAAIEKSNSEVLHSYGYDTVGCTLHAAAAVIMPFFHFFWQSVHTVDHKS
jgi:2-methylcitrate dehydratase PrpD